MSSKREYPLDPTKAANAAKALRESLIQMGAGDDEALVLDTIEGETSLFETLDAMLERINLDGAMLDAIDAAKGNLDARAQRVKRRVESYRAMIEQAMSIAELPKLERPVATLTLSARAPTLVVVEEADIPVSWWKPADPTLDKKGLLAALKDGQAIPGVALNNAAPSVTIRVK